VSQGSLSETTKGITEGFLTKDPLGAKGGRPPEMRCKNGKKKKPLISDLEINELKGGEVKEGGTEEEIQKRKRQEKVRGSVLRSPGKGENTLLAPKPEAPDSSDRERMNS